MLFDVYQTSAIASWHRQEPPRQTLLFENGIQQQSPSRAVEAESTQRQAFGIEAHIARSNVFLTSTLLWSFGRERSPTRVPSQWEFKSRMKSVYPFAPLSRR
jgi:hypothetical protein